LNKVIKILASSFSIPKQVKYLEMLSVISQRVSLSFLAPNSSAYSASVKTHHEDWFDRDTIVHPSPSTHALRAAGSSFMRD
jgi:hypothetical protein